MPTLEEIELDLLLNAIKQRYGYDFHEYASPSLTRRLRHFISGTPYENFSAMIPDILRNPDLFNNLLQGISITVTEMFRDPQVYRELRENILPELNSFARINIWHAGCATGEEVYSMAILLKEAGLYSRANLYATDINTQALEKAKAGIYPVEMIRQGSENYRLAGGGKSFADYYHARYGKVILEPGLRENITFSSHNLVTDEVFNQMQLIICRNVLIYFNRSLQDRVLKLFDNSLVYNGILVLGTKESLRFSSVWQNFEPLNPEHCTFIKKRPAIM